MLAIVFVTRDPRPYRSILRFSYWHLRRASSSERRRNIALLEAQLHVSRQGRDVDGRCYCEHMYEAAIRTHIALMKWKMTKRLENTKHRAKGQKSNQGRQRYKQSIYTRQAAGRKPQPQLLV